MLVRYLEVFKRALIIKIITASLGSLQIANQVLHICSFGALLDNVWGVGVYSTLIIRCERGSQAKSTVSNKVGSSPYLARICSLFFDKVLSVAERQKARIIKTLPALSFFSVFLFF